MRSELRCHRNSERLQLIKCGALGLSRITFFVGPNGCGKTQELLRIREAHAGAGRVAAITNTPFSRFSRSSKRKPVLRVSPYGVQSATDDNLVNFYDAPGRDTFDISDLLLDIGFRPEVQLVAQVNLERLDQIDLLDNPDERDAVNYTLQNLRQGPAVRIGLSSDDNSLERSFRGRNRAFFKHVKFLRKVGVIKSADLIFNHNERGEQKFSELSSGEQTIISTFLFLRSNLWKLQVLLIDEPENSLHPKWQRKYLEFIHMAIGYSEARIVIATHSPVIVSGGLSGYQGEVEVLALKSGEAKEVRIDRDRGDESVEEILFEAFDTITPANSFLSELVSEMTWDVQEGRLRKSDAVSRLEDLRRGLYSRKQVHFVDACIDIIRKI